jgi:hypothetical protein
MAQQEDRFAYTVAPTHPLKSIAACKKRFLHRRKPYPTRPTDTTLSHSPVGVHSVGEQDVVLEGLQIELDNYLHEPLMEHVRDDIEGGDAWCDPLLYWAARAYSHSDMYFSPRSLGR